MRGLLDESWSVAVRQQRNRVKHKRGLRPIGDRRAVARPGVRDLSECARNRRALLLSQRVAQTLLDHHEARLAPKIGHLGRALS